jgi:hypothetical protein
VGREWSGIEVHISNEVSVCLCVVEWELSQAMKFLPHAMMD